MARILAIDYGTKRVGVAVTDPLGMIAGALATVDTPRIFDFLNEYLKVNDCNRLVIGYPLTLRNEPLYRTFCLAVSLYRGDKIRRAFHLEACLRYHFGEWYRTP